MPHGLETYINRLPIDGSNSHSHRAISSFLMLKNVDKMIEAYQAQSNGTNGNALLRVFGLLQGFFVGIDALYDLAIGLTKYKYHININRNPILHELKYVRNDIVGHPTHRTYPNGGTGFSIIGSFISTEKMTYETFTYQRNKFERKERTIYFDELITAYLKEKEKLLNELYDYLVKEIQKTSIPEDLHLLYETLSLSLLDKVEAAFIDEHSLTKDSNHRFLWRTSLLRTLINWQEDDLDRKDLIVYMSRIQAAKLYEIALALEKREKQELYTKLPRILVSFFKFIRKNEEGALPLLENIHDLYHPLYQSDLESLYDLNPSLKVKKVLDWMKSLAEEEKVYLLGSVFRSYRKK
ncbi:MAG: hypothetical protein WC964_02335 [Acholeplasmataceae bacterium]